MTSALALAAAVAAAPVGGGDTVRRFVEAFNAQDATAMTMLVVPDVEWVTVDGAALRVESSGRDALHAGMTDYFKSCPSCRSTLTSISETASRVTTIETASWFTKARERREQQAIAIYEFDGPLISRVLYFPSEPVAGHAVWRCRNNLEVHCAADGCSAESGDGVTPMDVVFGTSGGFSVCAYSGCWDGAGTVAASGPLLTIMQTAVSWSDPARADGAEDVLIAFDADDQVAIVKAGGFTVPLNCKAVD